MVLCFHASAQTKILFDATKAETAGNADWVIDAALHNLDYNPTPVVSSGGSKSNPAHIPLPAQSGITASTAETYWDGGLSAWGVDCVKKGYMVETLPYNGSITYGNSGNAQDLSNYKVFVVCEPNLPFTATEKTAMLHFVQAGGGLFVVSDHYQSDRNNDGWDSPGIWNDFLSNNTIQTNPFGLSFDLLSFSGTYSNISAASTDSIIHGTMGNVTQVQWSSGTSMTLTPSANPTVKGVAYKSGSGNTNVLAAYGRYGSGKFAAIGDSSPCDDGTGNPDCTLYNGYTQDANGNHQRLLMNMMIWLVAPNPAPNGVEETPAATPSSVRLSPNPAVGGVRLSVNSGSSPEITILDVSGRILWNRSGVEVGEMQVPLPAGMYLVRTVENGAVQTLRAVVE